MPVCLGFQVSFVVFGSGVVGGRERNLKVRILMGIKCFVLDERMKKR